MSTIGKGESPYILEAVYERDIDLLLLEELHSNERFALWFYREVWGKSGQIPRLQGGWHSWSDQKLGESDLVAIYALPGGRKHAVLTEDKADAPPQSRQAERYRQRGQDGVRTGRWDEFRTCIMAPAAYLTSRTSESGYDAKLSYESIQNALRALNPDSKRREYKAMILQSAIEKQRRGRTPRVHEQVTRFWRDYWEYATREFPELGMKEPGAKPKYSHFIFYAPPLLPKRRRIVHKLIYGHVDLTLAKEDPDQAELEAALNHLLTDGLSVVRTGKSISIRARVPVVDQTGEVAAQISPIREALKAGFRLLYVAQVLAAYNAGKQSKHAQ